MLKMCLNPLPREVFMYIRMADFDKLLNVTKYRESTKESRAEQTGEKTEEIKWRGGK